MVSKILCVAEKPSIAKAVANHLGQSVRTRNVPDTVYTKNYDFSFNFSPPWGQCDVVMTSVAGHLTSQEFGPQFRNWRGCQPHELFEAPIVTFVDKDKKAIQKNIQTQARNAQGLFIWTDCDREGEHIGTEIRGVALEANSRLIVKRAKFSNIEKAHVVNAAKNPIILDENQAHAVASRIELDLRIGAAFTRMQTLSLLPAIQESMDREGTTMISYGSCQFPTLGFVVDRYLRVKSFKPEPFWKIQVMHERDDVRVTFNWKRVHLFDRMVVTIIFERCLAARTAQVVDLTQKPTSKWRPLPLTTVELQKMGSRFLRMDSHRVMQVAEQLYQQGLISYPRTETDMFSPEINLRAIVQKQTVDQAWGHHADHLLNGAFRTPRAGRNNDQAHPPIHPVTSSAASSLPTDDHRRVYEFVVRRFLACCSDDAKGSTTTATLHYGPEVFTASGLMVLERNYLDIYPYDKWESSQQLPQFQVGETFVPSEAKIAQGNTTGPDYLTEPELIALMDANGIGTDATMAEHINKIKERKYVVAQGSTGARRGTSNLEDEDEEDTPAVRGGRGRGRGRGGRGRGGARGGRAGGTSGGGGNAVFLPTTLGVGLIEGYDSLALSTSLSKPFLRKEMERQMRDICEGRSTRNDVVQRNIEQYREVYTRAVQQIDVLKTALRKYVNPPTQP